MTVPSWLRRGCAAAQLQGGDSGGAFYAIDSSGRAWSRGNVIATNGVTGYAQPYTTGASQQHRHRLTTRNGHGPPKDSCGGPSSGVITTRT